jgi:hypothetical protein
MKKIIIIYGLIAGAIVSAMMLITMPMYKEGTLKLDNGEVVGYTTMVIAFSVIFVAIKSYRDKQSDGVITFWKGVKIGLMITLIASVMYGLTWEYLFADIGDHFMQKMTEHRMTEMQSSGATDAEIQAAQKEMAGFIEMYKNPLVRFTFSAFVEIFPVGVIITLISAALMKRKEFLPATEPA